MHYGVAVLDIDGTIVDSNDAHAQAWVEALSRHGHIVDFHSVRKLIGVGGDTLLRQIANISSESVEGRHISASRRSIFSAEYLPGLRPTRGARRMIEWLRREGVVIAIATSAQATGLRCRSHPISASFLFPIFSGLRCASVPCPWPRPGASP
jgi:phosphoglycolate phosphatase-like HAD superfamily hydrolase